MVYPGNQFDYTMPGDAVNSASRLEELMQKSAADSLKIR